LRRGSTGAAAMRGEGGNFSAASLAPPRFQSPAGRAAGRCGWCRRMSLRRRPRTTVARRAGGRRRVGHHARCIRILSWSPAIEIAAAPKLAAAEIAALAAHRGRAGSKPRRKRRRLRSRPAPPGVSVGELESCLARLARECGARPTGFASDGRISTQERTLLSTMGVQRARARSRSPNLQACQKAAGDRGFAASPTGARVCAGVAPPRRPRRDRTRKPRSRRQP